LALTVRVTGGGAWPSRDQPHRELVYRALQLDKRSQLFIRTQPRNALKRRNVRQQSRFASTSQSSLKHSLGGMF